MNSESKISMIISVLEDGDRNLKVSHFDDVPLGCYATIASSGHDGLVCAKTINTIGIQPCNEWSSLTSKGYPGMILKGEMLLLSSKRLNIK